MGKIIFFNVPATGHYNPSFPIVAELVRRGEDVIYVNSEEVRTKSDATGARFVAYPDLSAMTRLMTVDAQAGNLPRNMRDIMRIGQDVYPFALQLVEEEQPDVILFDALANWGRLVAKKKVIPCVSIVVTFAMSLSSLPPMPPLAVINTVRQMVQVLPSYAADAWTFRQKYKIYPGFLLDAVMSLGDMNIVLTAKGFQPDGDSFDDMYKFVGTTIEANRDTDIDFPFDQLTQSPLTYISLGTLAKNIEFIRTCFAAFEDEAGQYILSVGKQTDIASLGTIPENFIVRNYVPQLEVLQQVDAFITHGGLNSVHEGLTYGVPMVVVPQQPEQAAVALQVQKQSAGIALQVNPPFGNVNANELRRAVQQVLASDTYAQNAKKLGQLLSDAGGVKQAVDEIQNFMTE